MTGRTRPAQSRPNSAPPYYLGRPASWWLGYAANPVHHAQISVCGAHLPPMAA